MTNIIEARGLTKSFGRVKAVNNVSFEVRQGEVFGFLGSNGAGKTTTARMLTGVIQPDGGRAFVYGHDIAKEPVTVKQLTGVVPEISNTYVEISGWQNMMLAAALYGVPGHRAERRATDLLRQFDLFDRRYDKVRQFSKGMRQRLILCMALINEPGLLFLDEPTSGLDVLSSHTITDMLRHLNGAGTTIFLTTHNMDEANKLCDRIAIINRGTIAVIDSPENLKSRAARMRSIEVAFDRPVERSVIAGMGAAGSISRQGDKWCIATTDAGELIGELYRYSRASGVKVVTLNTREPSLEDVFLQVMGGNYGS